MDQAGPSSSVFMTQFEVLRVHSLKDKSEGTERDTVESVVILSNGLGAEGREKGEAGQ